MPHPYNHKNSSVQFMCELATLLLCIAVQTFTAMLQCNFMHNMQLQFFLEYCVLPTAF